MVRVTDGAMQCNGQRGIRRPSVGGAQAGVLRGGPKPPVITAPSHWLRRAPPNAAALSPSRLLHFLPLLAHPTSLSRDRYATRGVSAIIRVNIVLWRVYVRCSDGDRSMVNYVNPLAMYQGKGGQYGSGWYGWQHQNFEEQQWCAWNGAPTGGEWSSDPQFPKREPGEREIADMPSPARGDLASPGEGSPGSRPSQPPAPPRSPYEWMKKPNYQTQPNPGTYLTFMLRYILGRYLPIFFKGVLF